MPSFPCAAGQRSRSSPPATNLSCQAPPPAPGQMFYSNGEALRARARREGAETVDLGIAADTVEATTPGIRRARDSGADILITTRGASVGDPDLVKQSLGGGGGTVGVLRGGRRRGA